MTPAMKLVGVRLMRMYVDKEISRQCDEMPADILNLADEYACADELVKAIKDIDTGEDHDFYWTELHQIPVWLMAEWFIDAIEREAKESTNG